MGGMQFQTEHHLFPQIPFYNLPKAMPIIKEELGKINRSIVYGPVLWFDSMFVISFNLLNFIQVILY